MDIEDMNKHVNKLKGKKRIKERNKEDYYKREYPLRITTLFRLPNNRSSKTPRTYMEGNFIS